MLIRLGDSLKVLRGLVLVGFIGLMAFSVVLIGFIMVGLIAFTVVLIVGLIVFIGFTGSFGL